MALSCDPQAVFGMRRLHGLGTIFLDSGFNVRPRIHCGDVITVTHLPLSWRDAMEFESAPLAALANAEMLQRAVETERRIEVFMRRTGLRWSEVGLVESRRSGRIYIQWRGATALLPERR